MDNIKYVVEKSNTGRHWAIFAVDGTMTPPVLNGGYKTKVAAQQDLVIAQSLVSAFRAATTDWPTAMDYFAMECADEVLRAKRDLADKLGDVARHAAEDQQRVLDGRMPWFSEGGSTRAAVDVDLLHAAYRAKWEKLRAVVYAIKHTDPRSKAGIAVAVAWAFASIGGAS